MATASSKASPRMHSSSQYSCPNGIGSPQCMQCECSGSLRPPAIRIVYDKSLIKSHLGFIKSLSAVEDMRFTLRDTIGKNSIKVELGPEDRTGEIKGIALEQWGREGFVIRNGYHLLREDAPVGSCISEGDTVDLIRDPKDKI